MESYCNVSVSIEHSRGTSREPANAEEIKQRLAEIWQSCYKAVE